MTGRVLWLWPSWRSFLADAAATACLPVIGAVFALGCVAFGA